MIQMTIQNHLLIPFARPKWDIEKIRIAAVSPTATFFQSDTPCAYIDISRKKRFRLASVMNCFEDRANLNQPKFACLKDPEFAVGVINHFLNNNCQVQTDAEKRFLDHYFDHIRRHIAWWRKKEYLSDSPGWLFAAPLPLPQAHLLESCH